MKKIFKFLISFAVILIIAILVIIFKPSNFDEANENNDVKSSDIQEKNPNEIAFVSNIFNMSDAIEEQNVIIYNLEELKKFCSNITDEKLLKELEKYNDEFFLNNALLILVTQESAGSVGDSVIGVVKNPETNIIHVFIKRTAPSESTVAKCIVIEVASEDALNVSRVEIAPEGIDF